MSKKKNKFDLTTLVHQGLLKENERLYYVSDPTKSCIICKTSHGEFKVSYETEVMTLHAFVKKCLGEEPADHATKWLKTESKKTVYEIWQKNIELKFAA